MPLKSIWRGELLAAFQVALIALPLSLGIAVASGFPAIAGIVAAVVGGLLVSRISGTHVTINGPAAGLIVVILAGVERLGHGDAALGYRLTLAAIVCAGLIQVAFGLLRVGRLSVLFPNAAVHGMMAAIGIIVLSKQLPVLLGERAGSSSIIGLLTHLGDLVAHANPLVAGTGIVGIFALLVLSNSESRLFKILPAPVWVVAIGALVGSLAGFGRDSIYELWGHVHRLGPDLYLKLPGNVFSTLARPDFSQLTSAEFVVTTLSIALVASLETLLSAAAVDKLDPLGRKSNFDRDLLAIGVGTTVSGLLGGLPMIAEIVRSKANVAAGARTGWSNFFHGLFVLAAVVLFPWVLTSIPLASLAALLFYTGCRLASPQQVKHMAEIGICQVVVFLTTVVVVLATDLLIGIAAGIAMEVVLHLARRVPLADLIRCRLDVERISDEAVVIRVDSCLVFTNILRLVSTLEREAKARKITVDLSCSPFIDHTALARLHAIQAEKGADGVELAIVQSERHEARSSHAHAPRRLRA